MSKAFDTVDRKKLIDIPMRRGIEKENAIIIKRLLSQTNLRPDWRTVQHQQRVPQGDGLSPRLFTKRLDEILREIDRELGTEAPKGQDPRIHHHDYAKRNNAPIPRHLEYAFEVDFICDSLEKALEIVKTATKVLNKFNLHVNQSETEYTIHHNDTDLRKTKKLGTTLIGCVEENKCICETNFTIQ